jgi:predicted ATP-dependent endonuclease of OLD family
MKIVSLAFRGYRGFNLKMKFGEGTTVIVGQNGSGKTSILNLLSALTGHQDAAAYYSRQRIDYAKVVVKDSSRSSRNMILEIDGWDLPSIAKFKRRISTLTSYVLTENEATWNPFVTERREPISNQASLIEWLNYHDLGLERQFIMGRDHASLLVSETGGQRFLLALGMNRAPVLTPMLVESPERSLHFMLRRRLPEFIAEPGQQMIMTTHCPQLMSSVWFPRKDKDGMMTPARNGDAIIDLSDDEVSFQW